jgi:DNA-binding response OmpR family regulator
MNESENPKKILIVEDDRALRNILAERLREDSYQVFQASDGEMGLSMATKNQPDLILLDIIMPKMDGIEVLAALRKDPWGKDAHVIMLTNLSTGEQREKVEKAGVDDFLVKSDWDIEGIVGCIKAKISNP